jgi:Tfp pilus assembly protein PilO
MSQGAALWWERRRLWLPAAIFALVALLLLVVYQVVLAGRLGLQAGFVEDRERMLAELAEERRERETLLRRARSSRLALDALYGERLGSQARRLTATIAQVKALSRQAGLAGMEAISYSDVPVQGLDLTQKQITFQASGSYEQLRQFINFLEVTEAFLTLEEIRVQGDSGSGALRFQVRLSTLFAAPAEGDAA